MEVTSDVRSTLSEVKMPRDFLKLGPGRALDNLIYALVLQSEVTRCPHIALTGFSRCSSRLPAGIIRYPSLCERRLGGRRF